VATLLTLITFLMIGITIASLLVARHFDNLRWNEVDARRSEQDAWKLEQEQREEAERNREEAREALHEAQKNDERARAAVSEYLASVGTSGAAALDPRRVQQLQSVVRYYQEFLKDRSSDPTLRKEMAAVYCRVGEIQRQLGQHGPSDQSYRQAKRLYQELVNSILKTRTPTMAWHAPSTGCGSGPRPSPSSRSSSSRMIRTISLTWVTPITTRRSMSAGPTQSRG
jgi:hypothetical protein